MVTFGYFLVTKTKGGVEMSTLEEFIQEVKRKLNFPDAIPAPTLTPKLTQMEVKKEKEGYSLDMGIKDITLSFANTDSVPKTLSEAFKQERKERLAIAECLYEPENCKYSKWVFGHIFRCRLAREGLCGGLSFDNDS